MDVKQNIGTMNALIRITCGFTLLSWSTAKMIKRRRRGSALLVALIAGMKVGEGILRYCPVTEMLTESKGMTGSENKDDRIENQSY
ncbi:DUF2892 domain-containing protein [Peribacillus saganii]|uniref:DUF2892 domain-containing protein n=1 Tax=Peribacillus saganii TaxID=2303992 RepID=A0A372LNH4_9BACI|nr:DUF2892 domain-containing protein [Peribacillus saganii]RFU68911.1 DUF2892 domain-containing protein [Peribacillus saganii]